MEKVKRLFLLLCLLLGMTGCGDNEMEMMDMVLDEVIESGILEDLLELGTMQTLDVPEGEMVVHFLDVGQADCALLASGGRFMLIDGGNNDDAEEITDYLQAAGVEKLDMIVGTHPHEDHIGSLDTVLEEFDVAAVYMPDVSADTATYKDVIKAVKAEGLQVQHPAPGDVLDFNGLPVEIFAPVKKYNNLNNNSIVLRISVGERAFLFTGDVETTAEYDILEQDFDISADVLKVSHHGSASSSVEEFLAYTDGEYAVISVGEENKYDHPEKEALNRLKNYGYEIFRTDKQGTVVCYTDGKEISFQTEK